MRLIFFKRELKKKLGYSFDAENHGLSIADGFGTIPALLHTFKGRYVKIDARIPGFGGFGGLAFWVGSTTWYMTVVY